MTTPQLEMEIIEQLGEDMLRSVRRQIPLDHKFYKEYLRLLLLNYGKVSNMEEQFEAFGLDNNKCNFIITNKKIKWETW